MIGYVSISEYLYKNLLGPFKCFFYLILKFNYSLKYQKITIQF